VGGVCVGVHHSDEERGAGGGGSKGANKNATRE
jgi:hypothetical protein